MLTTPKNTIIPRPLLKRRLQSAYADALGSGNTPRIISTIGACHRNDVPLSSPNTKKMRLRIAASSNLQRPKCIVTIGGVPHDTSNTPIASSSSSQSSRQRPSSSPTLMSDNYYNDVMSNVDISSDDGRECLFDANENIEYSSPLTATTDGENDENHHPAYINNIIVVGNEYTTTLQSSDCEKWKNTVVVSCHAKSTKDVFSTMTFLPPLSDMSVDSSLPTPLSSTPSKVFNNGWKMEQETTRASSSGKEGPSIMERGEDRNNNESVHFASPPSPVTTRPKTKMTPAEKHDARDKARHWAESHRRQLLQSSSTKTLKKESRNIKLKRNQNDCFCNEVGGHGTDDVSSDSIASRVKSQRRTKIRYIYYSAKK